MESKQKRTALVTGGSSGIGRCTVAALSKAGYIVYEFSRRDVPVEGVKHMCVDVTDEGFRVRKPLADPFGKRKYRDSCKLRRFWYFRGGGIYRVKTGESTI